MHRRMKQKKHTKLSITFLTPQPHDKLVQRFFPFFSWSFHLVKHKFPYSFFSFYNLFSLWTVSYSDLCIFDFFYCFSMGKLKKGKKKKIFEHFFSIKLYFVVKGRVHWSCELFFVLEMIFENFKPIHLLLTWWWNKLSSPRTISYQRVL